MRIRPDLFNLRSLPGSSLLRVGLAALAVGVAQAQDADEPGSPFAGCWEGTIEVAGLDVTVELFEFADTLDGQIDIPAQGAEDLLLDLRSVEGNRIVFAILEIPGDPTFDGTLDPVAGRIEGTFSQGGASLPFALERCREGPRFDASQLDGLDEFVAAALEAYDVPGVGVAIVSTDGPLLTRGFGQRDAEAGEAVTADTLFAIGSHTKAMTATLVATLVEDELVDWDTRIGVLAPDLCGGDGPLAEGATLRDLLCHRSGLPRHDLVWYGADAARLADIAGRVQHLETTAELRSRWQYCNLGFAVAGHASALALGTTFDAALRERILEPLGMARTTILMAEVAAADDVAVGYGGELGQREVLPRSNLNGIAPAGSVWSSATDLVPWLTMHLGRGEYEGDQFLREHLHAVTWFPHIPVGGLPAGEDVGFTVYGLGWFLDTYRGHVRVHHGGNIDGFSAQVAIYPNDGFAVAVLANRDASPTPNLIADQAADLLLGLEPPSRLIERSSEESEEEEAPEASEEVAPAPPVGPGDDPAHPLDAYVGLYRHPGYGEVDVFLRHRKLQLDFNGFGVTLEHRHFETFDTVARDEGRLSDVFDALGGAWTVSFETDVDGSVTALTIPLEPSLDGRRFLRVD